MGRHRMPKRGRHAAPPTSGPLVLSARTTIATGGLVLAIAPTATGVVAASPLPFGGSPSPLPAVTAATTTNKQANPTASGGQLLTPIAQNTLAELAHQTDVLPQEDSNTYRDRGIHHGMRIGREAGGRLGEVGDTLANEVPGNRDSSRQTLGHRTGERVGSAAGAVLGGAAGGSADGALAGATGTATGNVKAGSDAGMAMGSSLGAAAGGAVAGPAAPAGAVAGSVGGAVAGAAAGGALAGGAEGGVAGWEAAQDGRSPVFQKAF